MCAMCVYVCYVFVLVSVCVKEERVRERKNLGDNERERERDISNVPKISLCEQIFLSFGKLCGLADEGT